MGKFTKFAFAHFAARDCFGGGGVGVAAHNHMLHHAERRCPTKKAYAFGVIVASYALILLVTPSAGVEGLHSDNLEAETAVFAGAMGLRPGMTICEMGAADGSMLVQLGPKVMPGGRLFATAPLDSEIDAMTRTVTSAGMGESLTTFKATNDAWAPGMADSSCDAIYVRPLQLLLTLQLLR